jgi:hypothetical protein
MPARDSHASVPVRPERPRRGMRARMRRSATFGFSVRLSLAIAATFVLLGTAGYLMVGDQLQRRLIATYAGEHRADAESFADARLRARDSFGAHRRISDLLAAIARRPGVSEAILIGPANVVEAAGDPTVVGERDSDSRIDGALRRGRSYVGREVDPEADTRDFEFVVPVQLADGRHAFEVTRDHELLDSQLRDVRRTAMLLVVVGMLGAALVFYLVGGARSFAATASRCAARAATGSPTCPTSARSARTSSARSSPPRATATG